MPECRTIVFRPLPWHRRLLRRAVRAWANPDDSTFWTAVAAIVAIACGVVVFLSAVLGPLGTAGRMWP